MKTDTDNKSPTNELYEPLINAFTHFNHHLFQGQLAPVIFTLQRKKHVMGFFAAKRWGNSEGQTCSEVAINPSYFANSRMIEVLQTLVHEMAHAWQFSQGTPSDGHYHNKEWAYKMIEIGLMPSTTGEPGGAIVGRQMSDFIIKDGRFFRAASELLQNSEFHLKWVDRMALPKLYEPVIAEIKQSQSYMHVGDRAPFSVDIVNTESLAEHVHANNVEVREPAANALPHSFFYENIAKKQTRRKYVCPICSTKVYGKPSLNIRCGDCNVTFIDDKN